MKIHSVSTSVSVVVLTILLALAFGNLEQGRTTAAAGSVPVTIVNTPVRITGTVALVSSQPFAANGSGVTQVAPFASDRFSVPAGKRLIVEMVTLEVEVPAGGLATCGLTAERPASPADSVGHRFAVTPQVSFNSSIGSLRPCRCVCTSPRATS
jgi:hypothetical protein